jgi:glycosyltransferase involved in cell wall biosynthesis
VPVRPPVQHRLQAATDPAVVDSSGRLVQDADEGYWRPAPQRGTEKRGGNAVQQECIGSLSNHRPKHRGPSRDRKWKAPRRDGDETHSGIKGRRQVGDPPVVQITASHRPWIAQRDEGDSEYVRVIHVVPTPFGAGGLLGGGERYPLELARALARHVECMLLTFGPTPGRSQEPGGLRVLTLRRFGLLRGHPAQPIAPQLVWSLRGADVVHTHQLRSAPSRVAAVTAAMAGQHRITTDHGLGGGGWGGLLPALFERFLTVSEYSANVLQAPADRTRIIYGGVDPARFAPEREGRRRGVLYLGRITPHKGIDILLRALPDGTPLTIAGSTGHDPRPPERDYALLLRQLATGRDVRFVGPVSDDDVPVLHRRAAVFVLPTVELTCYGRPVRITELLGLSALEAMASGTPVVASRTGGIPEIIRDGETGFLVTPGDAADLRDRLDLLLKNPVLARHMGEAARATVLERFTWTKTAERCLAAYEELSGSSKGAA